MYIVLYYEVFDKVVALLTLVRLTKKTSSLESEYLSFLIVLKVFQQKDRLENVYLPVIEMQTLKLQLSYCCQCSLHIQ